MALQAVEPTAVLLIRAWVEADGGLRARITRTLDASSHEQIVTAAASPEEVVRESSNGLMLFSDRRAR